MCYMVAINHSRVGVRELRQNLSVYLEQVLQGTIFRVTDRGREVALLVPMPAHASVVERLVASGRATPAKGHLLALGAPTIRTKRSASKALQEIRADRL
jgi:prevent-host-death family protein